MSCASLSVPPLVDANLRQIHEAGNLNALPMFESKKNERELALIDKKTARKKDFYNYSKFSGKFKCFPKNFIDKIVLSQLIENRVEPIEPSYINGATE